MTAKPKVTSEVTLDGSFLGNTIQVCVVTRDYQRTMAGLVQAGIGPWRVYTFGPETVTELTFRGKPASYSMKLCLAFSGSMMWEIVQPLTGPNLYEEFLEAHGEGAHHVAVDCNGLPWEARLAAFEERGFAMVQSGWWQGKVPYAYFETEAATTTTIETSSSRRASPCRNRRPGIPRRRRAPAESKSPSPLMGRVCAALRAGWGEVGQEIEAIQSIGGLSAATPSCIRAQHRA